MIDHDEIRRAAEALLKNPDDAGALAVIGSAARRVGAVGGEVTAADALRVADVVFKTIKGVNSNWYPEAIPSGAGASIIANWAPYYMGGSPSRTLSLIITTNDQLALLAREPGSQWRHTTYPLTHCGAVYVQVCVLNLLETVDWMPRRALVEVDGAELEPVDGPGLDPDEDGEPIEMEAGPDVAMPDLRGVVNMMDHAYRDPASGLHSRQLEELMFASTVSPGDVAMQRLADDLSARIAPLLGLDTPPDTDLSDRRTTLQLTWPELTVTLRAMTETPPHRLLVDVVARPGLLGGGAFSFRLVRPTPTLIAEHVARPLLRRFRAAQSATLDHEPPRRRDEFAP